MLSADGQRVEGWVTGASVLRALARHVTGSQAAAAQAQAAADPEHGDAEAMLEHPSAPLPGYQVIEVTIPGDSPAAGRKLGDLPWPPAATLVSVLHGRRLRPPEDEITLSRRRPGQPAGPGTAGRTPRAPGRQPRP